MGDSDILIRQELMKQGEITKIMKYFTIAMDSKKKKPNFGTHRIGIDPFSLRGKYEQIKDSTLCETE
jgi:hypothetical protein